MCSCKYWFVEQPNNTFLCDPYAFGSFTTRCVVEYTFGNGTGLEVEWYYKESPDGPAQMLTSSDAMIRNTKNCGLTNSELMVDSLADLANNVGIQGRRYFCRVTLSGKKLSDSQEFRLNSQGIIGGVQPACTINDTSQSGPNRLCIAPMTPDELPKPTTTQTTTNVPAVPSSTMLSLMPSATPESESPDPDVNSGNQGDGDDSNVVDAPLDTAEEILIYSAIGVAVFLFVVVSILVVCLCVCSSMFRQSKSCTCCGSDPPINSLSSSSNGRKLREKYMI